MTDAIARTRRSWHGMVQRCTNPNATSYDHYGGRGITVCARWRVFRNFLADMGPRPSAQHTIDRRDGDGNYEPGNCRWATKRQQAANSDRWRAPTVDPISDPTTATTDPSNRMLRVRLSAEEAAALKAEGDMSAAVRRALARLLGDEWPTAPSATAARRGR